MATKKQVAARKNIKKAQAKWKAMTPRARAIAQPQGRMRKKPGITGAGKFYRIEVRPTSDFSSFRTQDVGRKGGLERIAGHRPSGSWATAAWLISKDHAHQGASGELVITDAKDRTSLKKALRGKIRHLKGDVFVAYPIKNVAEAAKPTVAMKRAQRARRRA